MDLFERAAGKTGPAGARDGAGPERVVEGTVERIVYTARDGAFTVARLQPPDGGELCTVVGALPGVPVGARLRVRGHDVDDARFGKQLRLTGYVELAPETLEGMRRYLGSGLIKGVGKELARRIVERFGEHTLDVLEREPYRIAEVPGIGRGRADAIRKAWLDQKGVREVMVFLQGHGISPAFAARIYKRYGQAAIARVRENPYRLAFDVWGIGFLSADRLASTLGIARDAPVRIEAGVHHALTEAGGQGHVFLPRQELHAQAAARLEVDPALCAPAVDRLAQAGQIAIEHEPGLGEIVYPTDLYRAERVVAERLAALQASAAPGPERAALDAALARFERQADITLASSQRAAVAQALSSAVAVITGGPGVGKTTIVRAIVEIARQGGLAVALGAPTGRAAKRLTESTGQPAVTLHRLLEWRPAEAGFGRNAERPLEADLVIVDEASMLDVRLAADLLVALAPGTRLVLVGDVDQLPSVGPGSVLASIIAAGVVPTVRLTEIFRQASGSLIVQNAHRINAGSLPELLPAPAGGADTRDFFFLEEDDPARAAAVVTELVTARLPRRYGLSAHDVQVLVPMRRGELGASKLNQLIADKLTAGAPALARGERCFRLGDRVMQLRNDYDREVWNGDIGAVTAVREDGLTVTIEGRAVDYDSDELDQLTLAYAVTVHKSQGSEFPAVVAPIATQHFVMLQRNLLYTAVTRGKRLVVLVGSRRALALAVGKADAQRRYTLLDERLRRLARG